MQALCWCEIACTSINSNTSRTAHTHTYVRVYVCTCGTIRSFGMSLLDSLWMCRCEQHAGRLAVLRDAAAAGASASTLSVCDSLPDSGRDHPGCVADTAA